MKRSYTFAFLLAVFHWLPVLSQNIPATGSSSITACSTYVYDMGGATGNMTANADGSLTIYPSTPGTVVAVYLESLDIDFYTDYLYIYNGASISGQLLGTFQGFRGGTEYTDYREYYGTAGAITIRLKTGQYASDPGCKIRVRCAPTAQPNNMIKNQMRVVNSCNTTIYDQGGLYGDYENNSADTILILPDAPKKRVQITRQHIAINNFEGQQDQIVYINALKPNSNTWEFLDAGYLKGEEKPAISSWSLDRSLSFELLSSPAITAQGFRMLVSCIVDSNVTPITETVIPAVGSASTTCGGTVYDNGHKYKYLPNTNGTITILPTTPEQKVQIAFSEFNVASGDALTVYDGNSVNSPLLNTLSGLSLPSQIKAGNFNASGAITLKFAANASADSAGFKLTSSCFTPLDETNFQKTGKYSLSTCDHTLFDDGGAQADYSNNVKTWVTLTPKLAKHVVAISFSAFDLAAGDTLFVYDGTDTLKATKTAYTGAILPSAIVSQNEQGLLLLHFKTDGANTKPGFALQVDCKPAEFRMGLKNKITLFNCDTTLFDGGGSTIDYPNLSDASVTIVPTTNGKWIKVEVEEFELAEKDSLYIYNGDGTTTPLIGTFSGTQIPPVLYADNSKGSVTLRFKSDNQITASGFKIHLHCTSPPANGILMPSAGKVTYTVCDTIIYDSGGPDNDYSTNENGTIVLLPKDPSKKLKVEVEELSTESQYDLLKIYNGAYSIGLLASLSGKEIPSPLLSTASNGALSIVFSSDYDVVGPGFRLKTSCYTPPAEINIPTNGLTMDSVTCDAVVYDGGGPNGGYGNYQSGYLLLYPPDSSQTLSLKFSSFSTVGTYDLLVIYDGKTSRAPILFSGSGSTLPIAPITASNSRGALLSYFVSDDKGTSSGFAFRATCVDRGVLMPNTGSKTLTSACETIVYDNGGPVNDYLASSNSTLIFSGLNTTKYVTIQFLEFETEQGVDSLLIYNGLGTTRTLIKGYSGIFLPDSLRTIPTKAAISLVFKSNGATNRLGFKLKVKCDKADPLELLEADSRSEKVLVYPNPTNQRFTIKGALQGSTLAVFDITGNLKWKKQSDEMMEEIDASEWASGLYLITISNDNFSTRQYVSVVK